jgi:hypothetical protein
MDVSSWLKDGRHAAFDGDGAPVADQLIETFDRRDIRSTTTLRRFAASSIGTRMARALSGSVCGFPPGKHETQGLERIR